MFAICPRPGCPEITEGGPCPEHARAGRYAREQNRPSRYERGYGNAWRRTRARFLAGHPWCIGCASNGRRVKATEAHHVDGLGPNGPRGHDPGNLMPLCKPCHSRLTNTKS